LTRRSSAAKVGRLLVILLVTASVASFTVSCEEIEPGNPVLPAGFGEARLPDVSVKGYAYIKPQVPLSVPLSRFLDEKEPSVGLPSEAGIVLWSVWVGPRPRDFGMSFEFSDAAVLDVVVERLAQEPGRMEHMRLGNSLYYFNGEVEWVEALKASIGEGRFVGVEDAHPDEWKLIQLLPEEPPGEVLGAGFGKLDDEFLEGMEAEFGGLGGDVRELANAARIRNAVFGLYADETPKTLSEFDEDFLMRMGLSALVITKAGYPGFIINFLFSRAASGAGLEKVSIEGGDAYYRALQENLRVMVKNRGSIFFATVASERDSAQRLMESILKE